MFNHEWTRMDTNGADAAWGHAAYKLLMRVPFVVKQIQIVLFDCKRTFQGLDKGLGSASNDWNFAVSTTTFEHFNEELNRLVSRFEAGFRGFTAPDYSEARLRQDFLDPLFRALGWDLENKQGLLQNHREVEIESRTDIAGRAKRADYLFRTERIDRFICEAKKPSEELRGHAFQAKRYAWNKGVVLAVLSDFEDLHVYVVGSRPHADEPEVGKWKSWSFRQYPLVAQEMWDLLSREAVASGGIDKAVDAIPRTSKAKGRGKARQQWLIKPDRSRALDTEFLNFLDEARRTLAQDLLKENDRDDLLEDNRLNEAVQRILDRLLFLRICEDRDIDTGRPLAHILRNWRERSSKPVPRRLRDAGLWANDEGGGFAATDPRPAAWPLWKDVVSHFKALDRRPPSHIPFFNGNLFKEHFSETLKVGDEWLANFLDDVSDDESPYLFNVIPVEILGTIYERFLGKIVRPHGKGALIEEKPEVRKAGGVYYTPRYIVDYIVEQTVGKLLEDKTPEKSLELKILDPACGSGSFLIRAFERMCEHWQADLTKHPSKRKRQICWVDETTGDVHLSTDLKRRILTSNIYGVDLDSGAVEVTQLSLYLKMLEGENRQTLAAERDLFGNDVALLPPLQDNIKNGNSLIASDFSLVPEELVFHRAFDWNVQFGAIMKMGGFDSVIGNPPYIRMEGFAEIKAYLKAHYRAHEERADFYTYFIERALTLLNPSGLAGMIVSNKFVAAKYGKPLRTTLHQDGRIEEVADFAGANVFKGATVRTIILIFGRKNDMPEAPRYVPVPTSDQFARIESGLLRVAEYAKSNYQSLGRTQLSANPWELIPAGRSDLLRRLTTVFPSLREAYGWRPLFGIKTGLNEAFVVDGVTRQSLINEDGKSAEVLQPFLFGKDVKRYAVESAERYVIYFHNGKHPKAYPAVRRHLEKYRPELSQRAASQEWFELQQPAVALLPLLAKPKIVYPIIAPEPRFALDGEGFLINDKLFVLPTDSRFLIGILNSSLGNFFFSSVCARLEGSGECYFEFRAQFVERFPVCPVVPQNKEQKASHDRIVELVEKLLSLTPKLRAETNEAKRTVLQNAVDATDHQIDALVYELYGLTKDEISLVEKGNS